eukprot:4447514-Pyramimonas_sp.AAC.1
MSRAQHRPPLGERPCPKRRCRQSELAHWCQPEQPNVWGNVDYRSRRLAVTHSRHCRQPHDYCWGRLGQGRLCR